MPIAHYNGIVNNKTKQNKKDHRTDEAETLIFFCCCLFVVAIVFIQGQHLDNVLGRHRKKNGKNLFSKKNWPKCYSNQGQDISHTYIIIRVKIKLSIIKDPKDKTK